MPLAAWKQHVLEALERREGRARRLRLLLERHEKLQDRLESLLCGAGTGHWLEVMELRRERQELLEQLSFVTETLARTEAENREQRARMQRLGQDLGALQRQACELSLEAEGLHKELEHVRGLLKKVQQERQELEAHWVREKALEAERVNWALQQEEKYQSKVSRLREELWRLRAGAVQAAPRMGAGEASSCASWEESETPAVEGLEQAVRTSTSLPVGGLRSHPSSTGAEV
ncbi:uncharacterized protein LOC143826455 [Paroedura picta]|uniref:uncharacterized protein LOC143826455 n=1 Tax=Paroedura picta TaxID=143630 RepID=UPI0040560410